MFYLKYHFYNALRMCTLQMRTFKKIKEGHFDIHKYFFLYKKIVYLPETFKGFNF